MSSQVKLLPHIKRSDPEKEFDLLKQIGSGTYGEVYRVSRRKGPCVSVQSLPALSECAVAACLPPP